VQPYLLKAKVRTLGGRKSYEILPGEVKRAVT
jgi:hypothetical protein